jgi:hypothetical protein
MYTERLMAAFRVWPCSVLNPRMREAGLPKDELMHRSNPTAGARTTLDELRVSGRCWRAAGARLADLVDWCDERACAPHLPRQRHACRLLLNFSSARNTFKVTNAVIGLKMCEMIEHWNNEVQVIIDEITAPSVGERAAAIYSGKSAE